MPRRRNMSDRVEGSHPPAVRRSVRRSKAARWIAPAIAAACVLAAGAAEPPPFPRASPAAAGLAPAVLDRATALLKSAVAGQQIAGAVAAVARRGKLAYLESVGVQDLDSRTPMTDASLYRIYSMTKPATAVAVMTLHDAGDLSLGDHVSKSLPEYGDVKATQQG